ncbi:MAG: hypothetical protein KatS3mg111_2518 [Pirellulaceae bacterium]|nr:MAG: hypothetical protein KatS3mg111_2518 [Pirellulaceae bacterium]
MYLTLTAEETTVKARYAPVLSLLTLLVLIVPTVNAQPPRGPRPGGDQPPRERPPRDADAPPGRRGPPLAEMMRFFPLFAALDDNKDGTIGAEEIAKASELLKRLDKNQDGMLDAEELRPGFRGGPGRPGFAPGNRVAGPPETPDMLRPDDLGPGRRRPAEGRPQRGVGPDGQGLPGEPNLSARLQQWDQNGDGKLERDELPDAMRALFAQADKDNDGYLTVEELAAVGSMRGRGPATPEGRLQALFQRADRDGDGKLTKEEVPDRLAERFEEIDRNGDGAIDPQELGAALRQAISADDGVLRSRRQRGAPESE